MLCRARTRLLVALTAVLGTALMAAPAGATLSDVPVPVSLSPPGSTAPPTDQVLDVVGAMSTAGCRGASGRAGATSPAKLRTALMCVVNRERAHAGKGALRASGRLALAARRHAVDMSRRGYFDHVSPQGRGPAARARAVGWRGSIGEVLAGGCGSLSTPAATVAAWLNSPPHRAVLLGRAWVAGIGMVARAGSCRRVYWVMNVG